MAGPSSAGHTASLLMNEAIEAGRGMAGRISGTASRPANDSYSIEDSTASTDASPSLQTKIVTGLESFSESASSTLSSAVGQTRQVLAKVDSSIHFSESVGLIDKQLGVSAAMKDLDKKAADTVSHVYTAVKRGNPIHAISHAGSAATIGQAEFNKHNRGPLPTTTEESEGKALEDRKEIKEIEEQGKENENEKEGNSSRGPANFNQEMIQPQAPAAESKESTGTVTGIDGIGSKDDRKLRRGAERKAKKQKSNDSVAGAGAA